MTESGVYVEIIEEEVLGTMLMVNKRLYLLENQVLLLILRLEKLNIRFNVKFFASYFSFSYSLLCFFELISVCSTILWIAICPFLFLGKFLCFINGFG